MISRLRLKKYQIAHINMLYEYRVSNSTIVADGKVKICTV